MMSDISGINKKKNQEPKNDKLRIKIKKKYQK